MASEYGISTVETSTAQKSLFSNATSPFRTAPGTLKSGQNLVRGAVLGKITALAATSAAKSGGNTGGGTNTMDATTPTLVNVQTGVYTIRCITAATNAGTFRVYDPTGDVLGDVEVGATFANQIKFALADSGTDFIVGDGFDVTVTESGKYVAWSSSATNGSQNIAGVLVNDCDASGGDKGCEVYVEGDFNKVSLTYSGTIADGAYSFNNIIMRGEV